MVEFSRVGSEWRATVTWQRIVNSHILPTRHEAELWAAAVVRYIASPEKRVDLTPPPNVAEVPA